MKEMAVEIQTCDGTVDGFLYYSEDAARRPGVIHLTDIGGIRASHRGMAQRLAEQGFTVLLPNVFYRTGKPPVIEFPFRPGEERFMKRFAELAGPMTPETMERDYLRACAARPDKIGAAASFHGGGLFTDKPTSPHLDLPRIKARLYFGHATQDRTMPQEAIDKFNAALASWGGRYESEVYLEAFDGWTVPDSHAHNQPQAERAFAKLTQLFAGELKQHSEAASSD